MKTGFIGQGFIGKNYSDDLEERGHEVVRYSLEPEYVGNRDLIRDCPAVFIAVPTPTTPNGFDASIVQAAVRLCSPGTSVVIKSTILPGTTRRLQAAHPDKIIMHSPEFLREVTAARDARRPNRNIIGVVHEDGKTEERTRAAECIMDVLPNAPYRLICDAEEAEMVKYGGNVFLFFKVMFANTLYDICEAHGIDYDRVAEAVAHDPRIGPSHMKAEHQGGRGAGGHCFPKDFAAYANLYEKLCLDTGGHRNLSAQMLRTMEDLNRELLDASGKSGDILEGIYGTRKEPARTS
jgi:UDPglucose 6-dehydrogenase